MNEPLELPAEFATLYGLVSRYSPTGSEAAAVDWLVGRMRALGYATTGIDSAGNAVGTIGSGPRQIVLLGHIDTVPGEIPLAVREGSLYGRGAVDAKGPLAAFVDAAARVGPLDGWQICVVSCVDEEGDSAGARWAAGEFQPDYAIIGEPSRWDRLTLGYKGSAAARITCRRAQGHSAGPQGSPADAVFAAWQSALAWSQAYNAGRERTFDQAQLTLRGLSSGGDGFEGWAELRTNARLPLDLPPAAWYAQLSKLASGCSVGPSRHAIPAYQVEKNTPLVQAFTTAIRAAGGRPGFVLKTGTADLNVVAPVWGCPAAVYGPGDSSLDHTPDEHIELKEYARAVEVICRVLERLGGN